MRTRKTVLGLAAAIFAAMAAVSVSPAGDFRGTALTNADIIDYARNNIAPPLIIARINSSATDFDLSPEAMMTLKENGVPDDVLNVMTVVSGRSASETRLPPLSNTGLSDVMAPLPTLAPIPTASPAALQAPPLPAFPAQTAHPAPMPPPEADGSRFDSELVNIVTGAPETKNHALAWMIANRDQSLPRLRRAMSDQRPEHQAAAIFALGGMKDRESLPEIRRLLTSASPLVRQNAAEALAVLEDAQSIAAAEQMLSLPRDNMDGHIRLVGAARLVRTTPELAAILSGNPSALNRAAAAWSLAQIGRGAASAWPAMEKALRDDADPSVRREAARAVANFHDPASARLLEDACRRDPDVRKITLQAMADYPESVKFLVEVMALGAEQIAADEREAARASLNKLTGQDFALDGTLWSQWYAANGGRFPAPTAAASVLAGGMPAAPTPSLGQEFGASLGQPAVGVKETAKQVDVARWGIVVNPTDIPMAPEVDDRQSLSGRGAMQGGLLPVPGMGVSGPADPLAPSPNDFSDIQGGYGPTVPSPVETPLFSGGAGGGSPFRTWSSEPDRSPPTAVPEQAAQPGDWIGGGPGVPTASPQAPGLGIGESQLWGGMSTGAPAPPASEAPGETYSYQIPGSLLAEEEPTGSTYVPEQSTLLPSSPVLSPQTSSPAPDLGGMMLTLPGMDSAAPPMEIQAQPDLSSPVPASPFAADPGGFPGEAEGYPAPDPYPDMTESFPGASGSLRPQGATTPEYDSGEVLPFDESAAIVPADPGDYTTLSFPDDGFGAGQSYFEDGGADAGASGFMLTPPESGDAPPQEYPYPADDFTYGLEAPEPHQSIDPASPFIVAPEPGQIVVGEEFVGDEDGFGTTSVYEAAPEPETFMDAPPEEAFVPPVPAAATGTTLRPTPTVTSDSGESGGIPYDSAEEIPLDFGGDRSSGFEGGTVVGDTPIEADGGWQAATQDAEEGGLVSELWEGSDEYYQDGTQPSAPPSAIETVSDPIFVEPPPIVLDGDQPSGGTVLSVPDDVPVMLDSEPLEERSTTLQGRPSRTRKSSRSQR